jgi:hypothetical protein
VFLCNVAHHLGHILCYLKNGRWIHHCPDADAEFERSFWGTKRLRRQLERGAAKLYASQKKAEEKAAQMWPHGKPRWLERKIERVG